MRNSLLLITLGTALAFGSPSPLRAQASPAATTPNATNEPAEAGVLPAPVVFEWKAGNLSSFLDELKKTFGFDLRQRADIPSEMLNTRVPPMKVKTERIWVVLELYTAIAADYPQLGRWVWRYPGGDFRLERSAIYLVPPKQTDPEDSLSVRAFTLRHIPELDQKQLFELINVEAERLQRETEKGIKASLLRGDVHFHEKTEILVAVGGKIYVEMVGSLIDAFRQGGGASFIRRPYAPPQDAK